MKWNERRIAEEKIYYIIESAVGMSFVATLESEDHFSNLNEFQFYKVSIFINLFICMGIIYPVLF